MVRVMRFPVSGDARRRYRRGLRMNDDLAAFAIMVVIAGMRIVFVSVVLLRRSGSGDGERQRRHPDRRRG